MELIRLYQLTLLCRVMPCYGDLGRHTPTRNIARLCWERAVQLSGVVSYWSEVFQTWNCTLPSVNEARHASDVWWVSESVWINHEISAHIAWPRLLLERTCFQRHNMLLFCAELYELSFLAVFCLVINNLKFTLRNMDYFWSAYYKSSSSWDIIIVTYEKWVGIDTTLSVYKNEK